MRYYYRCYRRVKNKGRDGSGNNRLCNGRRTLPRQIEFYIKRPLCPNCKTDTLTQDKYRQEKERGKSSELETCNCDGYPWDGPHRKGSKWCRHYEGEYTDAELEEYYHSPPGLKTGEFR